MQPRSLARVAASASFVLVAAASAPAQFATSVVSYNPGTLGAGESSTTANVLGGPVGGGLGSGGTDVLSLGEGGSVTLAFDVTIADGPGVDFTVFENGFLFDFGGFGNFAEVAFVEVSTDGTSFARLPSSYAGVQNPPDFSPMPLGTLDGLAGALPVVSNVFDGNTPSPFEPVLSGGDAFDLATLADHPLVMNGTVDLAAIHFVRLVDAPSDGSTSDTAGTPVWDSRNAAAANSIDVDAVAVIQHTGTISAGQPEVDLWLDGTGHLHLRVEDPDGTADLDLASFMGSFSFARAGRLRLSRFFDQVTNTPNGFVLSRSAPVTGTGFQGIMSISIRDQAGNFSADRIVLQG
jgi:hypothetical protein